MYLSKNNKKNNLYPYKPQLHHIKVGFEGSKLYRHVFVMKLNLFFFFFFFFFFLFFFLFLFFFSPSETGSFLKGKNLLYLGANYFLLE